MSNTLIQPNPSTQRGGGRRADAWRALAVCVFLVVAVLLVFSRTFTHGFCGLHDYLYILDEPHVSGGLSWSGVAWAFTNGPLGEWYPLSMLSAMLDCQLYGLHPAGHHVTSVLLHAASAVMLFLVLWRMTGGLWPSALVAALFALHPLHVEPVAWVSQRRDILSGLFFMLTLGAYGEYVRHQSLGRYLAVAVLFALGLMAKPMLVTLPALLLLLDFWPLGRFRRLPAGAVTPTSRPGPFPWRVVVDKVPLFALALADAGMTMRTHGLHPDSLTFAERLANAVISYVVYIGQLFVPIGLSIFNAHPEAGRPAGQVAAALALLLAITAAAVIWRRAFPYFFVGWFWYVGMLVPVSGLVNVGTEARDDRYTYLSQIGLYIALVWGAMQLGASLPAALRPARRWVFGIGSALVLAALMACSWRQAGFWQNDEILWERALACDSKNVTAHYFLGTVLDGKNQQEAIGHFRQALEIGPNDQNIYTWARAEAHVSLGEVAERNGDAITAIAEYEQALALEPDLLAAQMNLGTCLARQGKLAEAIDHFQRVIDLSSDGSPTACCNLAVALSQQGNDDAAIANYRKALKADRNLSIAHVNLAILLARRDLVDEAILHFQRAIEIDPNAVGLYFQIAQLLRAQGKTSEAASYEQQGIKASRRTAETRNLRGVELAQQGKADEAIAQFRSAVAAAPDFAPAHCNLADALAFQGHIDEAAAHYQQALKISPNFAPAKRGLQHLYP